MAAFVWASVGAGNWSVGANWQVGGVPQAAPPTTNDTVTFGAGTGFTQSNCTLDITGACSTIIFTGYTGTFTYSGQTLNVSGATITLVSGMTLTGDATSAINVSGTTTTFQTGSKSYPGTVSLLGAGTTTIAGAATFVNLTCTGTAVKGDIFSVNNTTTVTGTLTVGGNTTQGINRLLVRSNTVGTQRTIIATGAAVVISGDVDFKDITITGSPSWTNGGSAYVGDCLGNGSLITTNMTTAVAQTYNGTASDNWSTLARWTSRVPLPQDNVTVIAITAGTLTMDMPRIGANIDFTGTTRTVAFTLGIEMYGNWTSAMGMTYSGTNGATFAGRGSQTITSNNKIFTMGIIFNGPGGTYTLQDDFTNNRNTGNTIDMQGGTLVDNGKTVALTSSGSSFRMNNALAAVTMTGTWNLSGSNAITIWNVTAGTVTATGSTIAIASTSANTRTFAGGGKTYGTLTYTVAGSTGELDITGSNTLATINFSDATNARTLAFTAGTTTTITSAFNVNGTATKLMTIGSITAASHALVYSGAGDIICDYLSVSRSDASPVNTWYAGANSTDGGNNTGWIFTAGTTTSTSSSTSQSTSTSLSTSSTSSSTSISISTSSTSSSISTSTSFSTSSTSSSISTSTTVSTSTSSTSTSQSTSTSISTSSTSTSVSTSISTSSTSSSTSISISISTSSTSTSISTSSTSLSTSTSTTLPPNLSGVPRVIIRRQALTTPPFIGDSTLVDDTVALVDDTVALSGGQTTIYPGIKANVALRRHYTNIRKRR